MKDHLPGLTRHVARLFAIGSVVTFAVGFFCWWYDQDRGVDQYASVLLVMGTLTALQLLFWFGLTYWADLATKQPASHPGIDD